MTTERYFKFDQQERKWREVEISLIHEGDVYAWVIDNQVIGYYRALAKALIQNKGLIESETQDLPVLDPTMWRFTPGGAVRFIGVSIAWMIVGCWAASYGWTWPLHLWFACVCALGIFVLYLAIIQPRWFLRRWF